MSNILEELINLEIRKRELEKDEKIVLLLKLVDKYNTFYSHKCDVEEALLLENLIDKIKTTSLVSEYFDCIDGINDLLEHIYFEENGQEYIYTDVSSRKFLLYKNR